MKKLSIALATHNEEDNIGKCLGSVVGLASEIVIVDGESIDNTVEIAKSFHAKVIEKQNEENFHINKQIAIDNCHGDWILQLDADEEVSQALKKEILELLKEDTLLGSEQKKNSPNGYNIPRKNWFLGRFLMKGGQYPDYTVRLYRKGKGRLPQRDVHEQAVIDGSIGVMNGALLHYPYKNFKAYIKKWSRYNTFEAGLIKNRFKNKSFFYICLQLLNFIFLKPIYWFLLTYIRHKGFMDLWPGFVFSLFSSLRFPVSYILYIKKTL